MQFVNGSGSPGFNAVNSTDELAGSGSDELLGIGGGAPFSQIPLVTETSIPLS